MFAAWLRLAPVCPSKASVNPGGSASDMEEAIARCLPLSANTLAEAEGGSGAGAALWHGFSTGAGAASALPALLCDVVVMACTHAHTHSRQTRGGRAGEERRGNFSLRIRESVLCCAGFSSAQESVVERPLH